MFSALALSTSDLEEVLTQLQWPFLSPPVASLSPPANGPDLHNQLELLVSQLLSLQTSYPSASVHLPEGSISTLFAVLVLILLWVLTHS